MYLFRQDQSFIISLFKIFKVIGHDVSFQLSSDLPSTAPTVPLSQPTSAILGDIFGFTTTPLSYVPPKQVWLTAENGKGLEVLGTFSRK